MVRRAGLGSLGKSRNYYQYNYIDVIQKLVPSVYQDTDSTIFGQEEDPLYSVLGKILLAAKDSLTLIPLSTSLPAYTLSGIQQQFVPRNNMTDVEPYLFENKILKAFGKKLSDFGSLSDWSTYVSGTLLKNIILNNPTDTFVSGVSANINSSVSSTGAAHQYLIDNLSWLYLLNFEGPSSGFDPSTISKDLLVSSTYLGRSVQEVDGVKGLFEYIWRNREVKAASGIRYIPTVFNPVSSTVSANIYASGTQLLDGLKTLIGVWYNPNDDASTELQTQLELLTSLGTYNSKTITAGPFQRFLKALSFAAYDVNSIVDDIGTLLDVDRCDKRFLNYLGSLIGWKVLTGDVDRWRGQLRQAVYLYKAKGTRKALETAVSLMFPESGFNAAAATEETWESYFPRLIYYLIATESKVLNDPRYNPIAWTEDPDAYTTITNSEGNNLVKTIAGVPIFDADDHDNNYRFATDYVLSSLQGATKAIQINGVPYDESTWDPDGNEDVFPGFLHRGAYVPVPPWENDRFYDTTFMTYNQLSYVSGLLSENRDKGGLEVPIEYVKGFTQHVLDNNLNSNMMAGLNLRWKFYTTSSVQPPNLDVIVSGGRAKDISLKDYWNSKGSALVTTIAVSALSQSLSPGVSGTESAFADGQASGNYSYKATTDEIVYVIAEIFRQFIPFHAVVKFYATDEFQDWADLAGSGGRDGFVYAAVKDNLVDNDDQILRNFILDGYIASAVSGLDAPSSTRRVFTGVPRTTRRRRNLDYIIPGTAYYRDGRSMPIARGTAGSGTENPGYLSSVIDHGQGSFSSIVFSGLNNQMNVSSFIPLGYNFSTGSYFSTKGPDGYIYDASNDLGISALPTQLLGAATRGGKVDVSANYFGIDVSSTYPCRALGYLSANYPMGPVTRAAMDYSTCAIYGTVMKNQKVLDMAKSLSPSSIANVSLGSLFWDLWQKHQRYFGGLNFNYVYDAYSASGAIERFARSGGRSLGAQLEGPGFFNSDMSVEGKLAKGDFGSASAFIDESHLISRYPQWKNIVAKEEAVGLVYLNFSGDDVTIQTPASFSNSPYDSRVKFPDYADTDVSMWRMNSLVSGVSLVGRHESVDRPSWAVYNTQQFGAINTSSNATNMMGDYPGTISLFNEFEPDTTPGFPDYLGNKKNAIHIRYSLNQGREFVPNPQFRWKSASSNVNGDTSWLDNPSASGIAGWALQAANTSKYDGTDWVVGNKGNFKPSDTSGSIGFFLSGLNPDTDQYYLSATVSGVPSRGHPRSAWIRAQQGVNAPGYATLYGLVPGRKYKLTVDFMTRDADASGVLVNFERHNNDTQGTDMRFNRNGGWTVGGMPFHQICPVLAPGNNQGLFNTCSLDLNVSSVFLPGDRYDLQIVPVGPKSSGAFIKRYARYFFKEIKIEEYDTSPTKNRLIPEKDYELSVRFRHDPVTEDPNAVIAVRVRVDNIPTLWRNAQNGYDSIYQPDYKGKGNSFAFDIVDQQWKNIIAGDFAYWIPGSPGTGTDDPGRLRNLYYEFNVKDSTYISVDPHISGDWKVLTIPFNTKNDNENSPDQWVDYGTRLYQPFIYKSGKPLHNVDTVYHVEIGKFSFDPYGTTKDNRTFLTIDKVAFKIRNAYDELLNFYTFNGLDNLFTKFDLQVSGDSSRNSYYSASAYQTSGGSRISYEEEYGNIYSGTVDTTNTYGDTSGVVYALTDD